MSTHNFYTMDNFPLIVSNDIYTKVCPECGLTNCDTACNCEECGCNLEEVNAEIDEFWSEDMIRDMEQYAKKMNDAQPFFKVSVCSGYYMGVQFYVEEDCETDIEEIDNEQAHYYFGECRSKVLRNYERAIKKINKMLHEAKEELGLIELEHIGSYSNGEAVYRKVS